MNGLKAALPLLLILALLCACACAPAVGSRESEPAAPVSPEQAALQEILAKAACPAGIAFLGEVSPEADEAELRAFARNCAPVQSYPFLSAAPFVDASGAELYAVVAKRDCHAFVYRAGESGEAEGEALYSGTGGDFFLLRCNLSELRANAVVSLRWGEESLSVSPRLSGIDARPEIPGCYDFSPLSGPSGEKDRQIAREILLERGEIRLLLEQGMTLLAADERQIIDGRECWIFSLGEDRDGQFVREALYGVCDHLIYVYDAVNDQWSVLGEE